MQSSGLAMHIPIRVGDKLHEAEECAFACGVLHADVLRLITEHVAMPVIGVLFVITG